MLRNRMSRVALLCGGVAIVLVVTGCQTGDDNAQSPDVPSISEAADSPPSTSPEAPAESATAAPSKGSPPVDGTPQSPAEKPAASNPNECKVADLKLGLGRGDAAAGTVYRELRFTNKGTRTCTIQGFPGVSYVAGGDGHQVGEAAYREGAKGPAISLTPGMTVIAPVGFVQVGNYDPAACKPTSVRGLRVYPPHEYDSMYVAAPGTGCAGNPPGNQLTVSTIQR
ncbi:MAG: DUF4232 domain-containing protein [Actinophytocola sp.]|uniref:DUF4232 domain-containing protein n=1 Tax=Actinophytocola sp. TaxID=1872138 RepID=UPI003D6AAE47